MASVLTILAVMVLWWFAALVLRWRFQFSVRSLLVLVLAVALPCGWLAGDMKKAREQKKAAGEIEKIAGHMQIADHVRGGVTTFPNVYYDWKLALGSNWTANSQPPGAPWLRNLLGEDFFADVVMVSTFSTKNADTALESLHALTGLQSLNLDGADVTDVGLKRLKGLTTLQELSLSYTKITDGGLENLKGLTTLQELYLDGTQVTDAGLENVRELPALSCLSLERTHVTDAGLDCLKHFKNFTSFRTLRLSDTQVTDAGLENLKDLTALTTLMLNGTQVTDAGLERLKGLTALRKLWVETKVTDAALKKLQKALPNCKFVRGARTWPTD